MRKIVRNNGFFGPIFALTFSDFRVILQVRKDLFFSQVIGKKDDKMDRLPFGNIGAESPS